MRTPEDQARLDWHNKKLLEAWGATTPDEVRPRLERIKQWAMAEKGYTRQEVDAVEDYRLVLAHEEAMNAAAAQDTLRRYQRGEFMPPAPVPTFRERLDAVKDDNGKADMIGAALPNWGETTDHTNRDRVVEMLERKQGIIR